MPQAKLTPAFCEDVRPVEGPAEALALFEAPVPKTAIATLVTEGCVQRWLKEQVGEA